MRYCEFKSAPSTQWWLDLQLQPCVSLKQLDERPYLVAASILGFTAASAIISCFVQ